MSALDRNEQVATAVRGGETTFDGGEKRVFSIFCQGTGGHRDGKCLELITEFSGAMFHDGPASERPVCMRPDGWGLLRHVPFSERPRRLNDFYAQHYQTDFLILDGVGTSDHSEDSACTRDVGLAGPPNPMPGDFQPLTFDKPWKDDQYTVGTNPRGTAEELEKKVSDLTSIRVPGTRKHRGDIMGDGWNDNIAHALWVLRQIREADVDRVEKKFPQVINMIGWSRGGVTTIKLAHWIYRYFVVGDPFEVPKGYQETMHSFMRRRGGPNNQDPANRVTFLEALPEDLLIQADEHLELNLFPIDPVPGRAGKNGEWGGGKRSHERFPTVWGDQDYRSLPPIVNNCIITLAIDECRCGFHPLDAETELDTGIPHVKVEAGSNVMWMPYPGIHRTQLRLQARDPADGIDIPQALRNEGESKAEAAARIRGELTAVPLLLWDLAWKFMTFHGTKFVWDLPAALFPDGRPLTGEEVIALGDEVLQKRMLYRQTRNDDKKAGFLKNRMFTGYERSTTVGKRPKQLTLQELFSEKLGDYVRGRPAQFLNEQHRAIMQVTDQDEHDHRQRDPDHREFGIDWNVSTIGTEAHEEPEEHDPPHAADPEEGNDGIEWADAPNPLYRDRIRNAIFTGELETMIRSQRVLENGQPGRDEASFLEYLVDLEAVQQAALRPAEVP